MSCQIDTSVMALRELKLKNINNIIYKLVNYMNAIIYCSDNQVNNNMTNLKELIKHLILFNNNDGAYSQTTSDIGNGKMFLNFSYLPVFLQAYLLSYDIFTKYEKNMVNKYIRKMYFLIKQLMMSKINNWRFGYGRIALLVGYILNDKDIYTNGLEIINFSFRKIDINTGFIWSEMDRGHRTLVYNCKSANFICDSLYFMINTSNIKLNDNVLKKVNSFANLIISTAMMRNTNNVNSKNTIIENNKYKTYTKFDQEVPRNRSLSFINYDFVYNILNSTNKTYINVDNMLINSGPLAIGQ